MNESIISPAEDRLQGVQQIADFLGVPKRRAQHLIERNQIPYGNEGRCIVASKCVLAEHYRRCVSGRTA